MKTTYFYCLQALFKDSSLSINQKYCNYIAKLVNQVTNYTSVIIRTQRMWNSQLGQFEKNALPFFNLQMIQLHYFMLSCFGNMQTFLMIKSKTWKKISDCQRRKGIACLMKLRLDGIVISSLLSYKTRLYSVSLCSKLW